MLWNQQVETLSKADMVVWQKHKFNIVMERVYEKSPFYQQRMRERQLQPADIKSIADAAKLPFTVMQDVTANYPYGLLTMPISGVAYIHRRQVGDQKPTAVSYTNHDITIWIELMSRMLVAGGLNVTSVLQVVASDEQYSSSNAVMLAARQVGVTVIPTKSAQFQQQISLMQDFGVTAILAEPEYLLTLAQEMRRLSYAPEQLPLQIIFCDMQSLTAEHSQQIAEAYGIQPLKIYGLAELFGMGIGGECSSRQGIHIQEDCFYPEIIQPESGQVLDIGQQGELVLTSLVLEAMPLIRYRTGQYGYLDDHPCACGRTLVRFKTV